VNKFHEFSVLYHTFEKSKCLALLLFEVVNPAGLIPRLESWEEELIFYYED
jgi:hypothetical protein